ncbi:MAG: hypothetical protein M1827_003192 [Pycnora praestabilis]|nr:MAG: hypothetical protein M1827_003192 [Pycnora praestabilis]
MAPELGREDNNSDFTECNERYHRVHERKFNTPCICKTPLQLLQFPDSVRNRILGFLLHRDSPVRPYYNEDNSAVLNQEALQLRNIDSSILLVNRQFNKEASTILYRSNTFQLTKPSVTLWWFNRIGTTNAALICRISIVLSTGLGPLGVLQERVWVSVFLHLLLTRQRIQRLYVDFTEWHQIDSSYNWLQRSMAEEARKNVVVLLSQFRVQGAWVRRGMYLSKDECRQLVALMLGCA